MRYLQDVSSDDTDDAGLVDAEGWVVRRTVIEQRTPARLGEQVELATFCSGWGSRWAERRVSITGDAGALIDAVTVWVHLDAATGRPLPLPTQFHDLYDEAAAGRVVNARQIHDPVEPDAEGVRRFPWPLRATDLDVLDHANNSMAWAVVEQLRVVLLSDAGVGRGDVADPFVSPFRAEVEFRQAVDRPTVDAGSSLSVHFAVGDGAVAAAVRSPDEQTVHITARLAPLSGGPA